MDCLAGCLPCGGAKKPSLWVRMGGEEKIRPLCNDLYTMHSTDPLTAPWFGAHVSGNKRSPAEVKENVFTFFSAGIGGPHEYKGQDMKTAHAHMYIQKHAFHALTNHVLVAMEKHNTGGSAEREEVYKILMSLRDDVMDGTKKNGKKNLPWKGQMSGLAENLLGGCGGLPPSQPQALWDRMGGESKVRPLCNTLYDLHSTDPLTAPWFAGDARGNIRTPDEVKENVFTFFSSGIGGPHEYKGRDMKAAHAHMKIPDHVFHALTNHVFVGMEKHKAGGSEEREEVYDILMSLRADVMDGSSKK